MACSKNIIHRKKCFVQIAFGLQKLHLIYKHGIPVTKTAFRLQIFSSQFTKLHLELQSCISACNSAITFTLRTLRLPDSCDKTTKCKIYLTKSKITANLCSEQSMKSKQNSGKSTNTRYEVRKSMRERGKNMKKLGTVIVCLIAIVGVILIGRNFLVSKVYNIHFDENFVIENNRVKPDATNLYFTLDEEGEYRFDIKGDVTTPGMLYGLWIEDEEKNILFYYTGDQIDVESMALKLEAGEYRMHVDYMTEEKQVEKFLEKMEEESQFAEKDGQVVKFNEENSFQFGDLEDGEWSIHYHVVIWDVHRSPVTYGLIIGLVIGLLLVVIMLAITKTNDKIKCDFDERHEMIRGKGFKYAFFTMVIGNGLFAILHTLEISLFADMLVAMTFSILLGVMVFACYCIWNDGYFALNENKTMLMILFAFIGVFNIVLGATSFAQGVAFVDGRLTIRSLNLFCGILMLIIFVTILCKHIKDGREE